MKKRHLFLILGFLIAVFTLAGCHEPANTGWETNDHGTFYRDATGIPVTGWQEIDGNRYYFGESGAMVTGWQQIDGITHFFDNTGAQVFGWVTSRGMRYYLTESGPLTGWQELEGKHYYFLEGGSLLTGWAEISGSRYYFDEAGQTAGGWREIDGRRYLLDERGKVLTGWQEIDGHRFHLSKDGSMTTGWYTDADSGYEYYFFGDGTMAVGTVEIDGITRYFTNKGVHILLVNPWHPLPDGFKVELVYVEDGYQMDIRCYDALVRMLADCRSAGYDPKLVSGYRTQDVQEYLFDVKVNYYLDLDYSPEEARVEAAKSIAIPGTSEHQIGLAVDILEATHNAMDDTQADTATQKWLMEHCHEYGFILRYPEGTTNITGIIYEPWHYRYVGVEIATEITERGITLEEYLNAVVTD